MINLSLISYQVPRCQIRGKQAELLEPCSYHFRITTVDYVLTIYPPYKFEASIPWGFRWLLGGPTSEKNLCYACPHDALYDTHLLSKQIADKLLDEVAERVGKLNLVSTLTYRGVKWFGGRAWSNGGNLSPEKVEEICTLEVIP